jgi:hypothetical protein
LESPDIVILTYQKHGLGYTVSTYGTEGLGKLFIGKNPSDRSEEGKAIVTLFQRLMAGKVYYQQSFRNVTV